MTAYISRNATEESIGFITTLADKDLTDWCLKLAKEYISIPAHAYELDPLVKCALVLSICVESPPSYYFEMGCRQILIS